MNFAVFIQFFICLGPVYSEQIPYYLGDAVIYVNPTDLGVNLPILDLLRKDLSIRKTESSKEIDEKINDEATTTPEPADSDASNSTRQDFVTVQEDILNITVIPTDQTEKKNVSIIQPEEPEVIIIESLDKKNISDQESVTSSSLLDDMMTKAESLTTTDISIINSENQDQPFDTYSQENETEKSILDSNPTTDTPQDLTTMVPVTDKLVATEDTTHTSEPQDIKKDVPMPESYGNETTTESSDTITEVNFPPDELREAAQEPTKKDPISPDMKISSMGSVDTESLSEVTVLSSEVENILTTLSEITKMGSVGPDEKLSTPLKQDLSEQSSMPEDPSLKNNKKKYENTNTNEEKDELEIALPNPAYPKDSLPEPSQTMSSHEPHENQGSPFSDNNKFEGETYNEQEEEREIVKLLEEVMKQGQNTFNLGPELAYSSPLSESLPKSPFEDYSKKQDSAQLNSDILDGSSQPQETGKQGEPLRNDPTNSHEKKPVPLQSSGIVHDSDDFSLMLEQLLSSLHTNSFQRSPWHTGVLFNNRPTLPFSANAFGNQHSASLYPFNMGQYNSGFNSVPSMHDSTRNIQSRNPFYKPRLSVRQDYYMHPSGRPHIVQTFRIPSPTRTSPYSLNPKKISKFGLPVASPKSDLPEEEENMRSKRELHKVTSQNKNSDYSSLESESPKSSGLKPTSMIPVTWMGSPESSMAMTGDPQFSYRPPSELYLPPYAIDYTSNLQNIQEHYGNVPYDAASARRVYGSIYIDDPQKRTSTQLTTKSSCRCGVRIADRILGGTDTVISKHPWMAQIRLISNDKLVCGGTIISDRYILTAAHCFESFTKEEVYVKLGASKSDDLAEGKNFDVEDVTVHERYENVMRYDIALVKLACTIQFSPTMLPICLPSIWTNPRRGIITGWGTVTATGSTSPELQEASVRVYRANACRRISSYQASDLPSSILCARDDEVDACQGDSGGPLALDSPLLPNVYQIGITSWGNGCGKPKFPGVYTRVASYLFWIIRHTQDSFYCSSTGSISQVTRADLESLRREEIQEMYS